MAEFTPLPTDYVDDILSSSNTRRKYQQTDNSDGTKSFADVTEYDQEGTDFGAVDVNRTNKAINDLYANRIVSLDDLDLVTETGFFVDALVVKDIAKRYVVEEGSNSNGKYIKWSNGDLEMWGDFDRTAAITERAGSLYASSVQSITFPIQSLTRPNIELTVTAGGAIWGHPWDSASGYLRDFSYQVLAATQWSNASYHVSYQAKGTWK